MSKLTTTTSGTRPDSPDPGSLLYETDTKNVIFWDGTVWRVYNYDRISYATTGVGELNYPTGLWSSAGGTYYISTSPEIHFDAKYVDGVTADNNPAEGAAVSTWADRSGSSTNYDATQASASLQPTWAATGSTGVFPTINFNSDKLELTNEWTTSGDFTQITVSKSLGVNTTAVLGQNDGGYANIGWWKFANNQHDYLFGASRGQEYTTTINDVTMHTITRAGADGKFFETGGTSLYTGSHPGVTVAVRCVGKGYVYLVGEISEALVFNSALSTADLNVIRLYLDNKYDLTSTAFS